MNPESSTHRPSTIGPFRSHRPTRRLGFTLVELMVVITIFLVLAALSFVGIRKMYDKAIMAEDSNKLRQISTGLAAYASEHHNTLPNSNDPIPGTSLSPGSTPDRWIFYECVDRYLFPPDSEYKSGSIYNWLRRPNSPFHSKANRAPEGWSAPAGYDVTAPQAFGYNPNINHGTHWRGKLNKIPRPGSIVVMAEFNIGGQSVNPRTAAVFENNVKSRYRVSRPGKTALYLFADHHVESLQGDRGYDYYDSHPNEANIWRWW